MTVTPAAGAAPRPDDVDGRPRGAYGYRLVGLGAGSPLLGPAADDWPVLELSVGPPAEPVTAADAERPPDSVRVRLGADDAELELGPRGRIAISRSPLRATLALTRPPNEHELMHPHLGAIAAVAGRWLGRDALHAGAVALDGGVWAVLGGREAGKSSLLAWLALQGLDVVCDDVLLVDRGRALPGPRFVDLRADTAAELGVGQALGRVGARDRWRMPLPIEAPALPLRGWLVLGWGEPVALDVVPPSQRVARVARQLSTAAPPVRPESLIELASLPMLEFRRPRSWEATGSAGAFLLERLADVAG